MGNPLRLVRRVVMPVVRRIAMGVTGGGGGDGDCEFNVWSDNQFNVWSTDEFNCWRPS